MATPRSGGSAPLISTPSTRMRPELMGSSPAMILSSVDLPQPDGPTSTQNSPSSMVSDNSGMTVVWPKAFVTLSIESVAMGLAFHRAGEQAPHEGAQHQHIKHDEG